MHKILIFILAGILLQLSACSSIQDLSESVPEYASKLPLMYRPTIQQGNVIEQEMINKLKPGMSKRQVTYILGTPGLVDSFHQNRWDYIYTIKENAQDPVQKNLTLYFKDEQLVRIGGDWRPMPVNEMELADKKETVVDVPDYEPEDKGIVTRTLEMIGIEPLSE